MNCIAGLPGIELYELVQFYGVPEVASGLYYCSTVVQGGA